MKKKLLYTMLLLIILGLMWTNSLTTASNNIELSTSGNYERTFTFSVQYGHFQSSHTLYTSMPPSLYDYYNSRNPIIQDDTDYAKYVTPTTFQPIADTIQNATANALYSDEQFANAVLELVRQINYTKSPVKYPAEAIIENTGDCDVLSLLAASILKAGGLDVVLLYYKGLNPSHMNVGIYLPNKPVYRSWWIPPTGFEYDNKTYWMAEATSRGEWKVGDRPELLTNAKPYIIPVNNSAKTSPGQISASLDKPLIPTSISITLSSDNPSFNETDRSLTITGETSPTQPEKNVTMYVSQNGLPIKTLKAETDEQGNYTFTWNLNTTGVYHIKTSWSDSSDYAGSDSETLTILASDEPVVGEDSASQDAFTPAYSLPYQNFISQSAKELLKSNLTGTGVYLSGEFIILGNNQTAPPRNQTITRKIIYVVRNPRTREYVTIVREEQIPVIEETTINQLGLILQQNGDNNYSASVRVLEDQDLSKITEKLDENNPAFMNASQVTRENTWYKLEATISNNATNAKLFEQNGTLLRDIVSEDKALNFNEIGILMAYEPGEVVAFKNLKVETLDQPVPQITYNQKPVNELERLTPYISPVITLTPIVAIIAYAWSKKKRNKTEQRGDPVVANELRQTTGS